MTTVIPYDRRTTSSSIDHVPDATRFLNYSMLPLINLLMRNVEGFPVDGGGGRVAESRAAAAADAEGGVRGQLIRQGDWMRWYAAVTGLSLQMNSFVFLVPDEPGTLLLCGSCEDGWMVSQCRSHLGPCVSFC